MIFLLIRDSVTNTFKGSNKPPNLIKKKKKLLYVHNIILLV